MERHPSEVAVSVAAIPVLKHAGVTLRPYRPVDARGVAERTVDPLTKRWATMPSDDTVESCKEWVVGSAMHPTSRTLSFAIEVEGRYAGHVGLRADDPGGHVFYNTCPWVRGRGVAAVGTALACEWAIEHLGWAFVIWQTEDGNVASAKTAWRAGFPPARISLGFMTLNGRLLDGWQSESAGTFGKPVVAWDQFLPAEEESLAQGA